MNFKTLLKHMRSDYSHYIIGLILSLFTTILAIIPAKIISVLIDKGIIGGDKKLIIYLSLTVIGISLLRTLLRYQMIMIFEKSSLVILNNLRDFLFQKLLKLDAHFYNNNSTGSLMANMTADLDAIRRFFSWVVYNSFEAIIMFLFSFIILVTINIKLTLLLLICAPFIFILNIKMYKSLHPVLKKTRNIYSELNSIAQENISANRVVKAFVREEYENGKMKSKSDDMRDINILATKIGLIFGIPIDLFAQLMIIIAATIGGIFVIKGEITLGEYTVFTGLSSSLIGPLKISGPIMNDINRFNASLDRITPLYYAQTNIVEHSNPLPFPIAKGEIVFQNVSLNINAKKILDNINLTIKAGEYVAIMGQTGCGKTMLVSLLLRLYDPTDGEIFIDGINIKQISLKDLRSKIGISAQDVFLFSNTIEGNIAYANPNMHTKKVKKYAKIACAGRFIEETENGYLTVIGERGVGLSGGQKQRLSLARALAVDAPILIFDDTTSALDADTEKDIHKKIENIKKCTKIMIAQKTFSVHKADRIIIMENGKIVDIGKHSELKERPGYYKRVFEIQHSDFLTS